MARKNGTKNTPQEIIDEIVNRRNQGETQRALATAYGKPYKTIINMITRENNKKRKIEKYTHLSKPRGRKPAITLQEYKYENKRLKMENELLRDFLKETGRN